MSKLINGKAILLFLIIACTLSSCVKAPSYSVIPAIKFVSVSSSFVKSGYPDTITFSFTDGDGDIGTFGSDTSTGNLCGLQHGDSSMLHNTNFNIFLIDSRDHCISPFTAANIQPTGKFKGISGNMLVIPGIFSKSCQVTPNLACPFDTAVFSILLTDMAGHFSNIVQTTPIVCDPH